MRLHHVEASGLQVTNYGEYLASHPPTHEAKIIENTAWSCVHGVDRWRRHCGCNSGGNAGWTQHWRQPLREALDWLRDTAAPVFVQQAGMLVKDPWAARDGYIRVVLERTAETRRQFVATHAKRDLSAAEQIQLWRLLEMQRHAMLMYTSCGWFFDEVSGLETVQVLEYAARVLQLQQIATGTDHEPEFVARLSKAKSNIAAKGDAGRLFLQVVKPKAVGLESVAAHHALTHLFLAALRTRGATIAMWSCRSVKTV